MTSLISGSLSTSIATSMTLATSSSTATSLVTSASTSADRFAVPAPLMTPWVVQPSCSEHHSVTGAPETTTHLYTGLGSTTSYVFAIASDVSRDASCMPSGWNTRGGTSIVFSPGVCPQSWTAYYLDAYASGRESVASCCSQGYTPFFPSIYNPVHSTTVDACVSEVRTTVNHADQYVVNITRYAHDPWMVRWRPSDTTSMSPQPPPMDTCGIIKSWVPGQTIEPAARPTCRSNDGGGGGFNMEKIFGIAFGLGIPFLIFLSLVCCCCLNRRKKRRAETEWRERRQDERAEREAEARERRRASRDEGIELQGSVRPAGKSTLNTILPPTYTAAEPRPVAPDEPPPSYAQHRRDDRVLNITRAD